MAKTIGFPFSLLNFSLRFAKLITKLIFGFVSLHFFKQRLVASFRFNFFAFKFFVCFAANILLALTESTVTGTFRC